MSSAERSSSPESDLPGVEGSRLLVGSPAGDSSADAARRALAGGTVVVDAVVVDASVAVGWFAAVPGSEQAVQLLEASPPLRLIAPDLVLIELLNAGWRSQRSGVITAAQLEGIAQLAPGLFTELIPAASLLAAAHRWCVQLDHPAVDCLYLALAERESAPLITQDQRLLQKLKDIPEARGLVLPLEAWRP